MQFNLQMTFHRHPLAILSPVIGGDALDDATMQAIAAEFNLSETTFVLAPADQIMSPASVSSTERRRWRSPVIPDGRHSLPVAKQRPD